MDRRRFFREGLRGLLDNVGKAAGPLQRAMKELEAQTGGLAAAPAPAAAKPATADVSARTAVEPAGGGSAARRSFGLRILRPPGAKPEADFITACSHCGNCVSACPVHAIQLDPDRADGVPFIIADEQPCAMCDGLLCMYNCPTGAIEAVPIGLVDMGTAEWRPGRCVRSQGTDCTMCVDRCPIGPRAIELIGGKVVVHPDGCTGCGVCEHDCPTSPKSIVVIPAARRDAGAA
ncbi:MAG: putative ferredoxin [Phycisphaerales bacterium]|nr:putative ferredoxin [Phycisphaerales bacterium]